ncbi:MULTISPECIES: hypothetical protein [unclassified Caballeronia]|uniref:hypothetical protein n=1 Tax=unclassified Caballeronia TaxID=2646786 RepID=UPI0020291E55|nr:MULTISPECIES: hypothetical protein [unclassified Caballeronia]
MIDGEKLETANGTAGNFAALGGMAADIDGQAHEAMNPGAAQAAAEAAAAAPDYLTEAKGTVEFLGAMLDGYAPGAGFKPAEVERMSMAVAPVMEKYGFTLGAMPCELVALIVCGPVLYNSAKVVAAKLRADQAEAAREARGLSDPNTIRGGQAEQVTPGGDDALNAALRDAQIHPVM